MHKTLNRPIQNWVNRRIILLGLVVIVVIAAGAVSPILAAVADSEYTMAVSSGARIEYPVLGAPANIAVEAPGNLWFTIPEADAIGNLQTVPGSDAAVISYTSLAKNSEPIDLVYAENAVWFTERAGNRIGRIDVTTGMLQEYPVPTPNSRPTGIDIAPDGTVWFAEETGMKLAQFDPATESFEEYPFPKDLFDIPDPRARDVAVTGNNTVWFTVPNADAVGAYDIDKQEFFNARTRIATMPSHVVIDNTGLPWVTSFGAGFVGRFAPGTLDLWAWYGTSARDSGPTGIAFSADGPILNLWFSEYNAGRVGRLTVQSDGQFLGLAEYPLSPDSNPWGIAVGANDYIWVAESGRDIITLLRTPYGYYAYVPFAGRQ